MSRAAVIAVSGAALLAAGSPGAVAADPGVRVVASGFAGPLHVAVAPGGSVLVADAFLGAIDRVDPATGAVSTVLSAPGFSPGVAVKGQQVYYTLSEGSEEETTAARLMRYTPGSGSVEVADMLGWELDHNPDGQPQKTGQDADSNPYAVLALPGRTIVADAAGNDLVEVRANGAMRTLTVFPRSFTGECATHTNNGVPNGGCDPVPTDVKEAPDGTLWVSGLGAEVEGWLWRVDASTGTILETHGGFPPLTGVAVGDDGVVYAASLFADTVFRLAGGPPTVAHVTGPSGLALSRGTLYAGSVDFAGGPGQLVAISPAAFHH